MLLMVSKSQKQPESEKQTQSEDPPATMTVNVKPFFTVFLWTWLGNVANPTYSLSWSCREKTCVYENIQHDLSGLQALQSDIKIWSRFWKNNAILAWAVKNQAFIIIIIIICTF